MEDPSLTATQKSWIQNYKESRFNGLYDYEGAAQVFHHHQIFFFQNFLTPMPQEVMSRPVS